MYLLIFILTVQEKLIAICYRDLSMPHIFNYIYVPFVKKKRKKKKGLLILQLLLQMSKHKQCRLLDYEILRTFCERDIKSFVRKTSKLSTLFCFFNSHPMLRIMYYSSDRSFRNDVCSAEDTSLCVFKRPIHICNRIHR